MHGKCARIWEETSLKSHQPLKTRLFSTWCRIRIHIQGGGLGSVCIKKLTRSSIGLPMIVHLRGTIQIGPLGNQITMEVTRIVSAMLGKVNIPLTLESGMTFRVHGALLLPPPLSFARSPFEQNSSLKTIKLSKQVEIYH